MVVCVLFLPPGAVGLSSVIMTFSGLTDLFLCFLCVSCLMFSLGLDMQCFFHLFLV